jgi:DNA mismatch repair protein MutS
MTVRFPGSSTGRSVTPVMLRTARDSATSTSGAPTLRPLEDALFLGQQIMGKIIGLGALCVFVTFLDELASMDAACVSMVAAVAPGNPAARTYKVVRRPADGLAYAMAIAPKHGLTYKLLKERLAS